MNHKLSQNERLLLAAILISGRLPNLAPHVNDFTPGARRIWNAASELAQRGEDVTSLNVWRHDNAIDPVELCEIMAAFPIDLPSKHLDLMLMAFEGEVRRQREAA